MKTSNFLARGGEMGHLIRTFDWTTTSLGPIENWQLPLRTTLATMLQSRLSMFLCRGRDSIWFNNDAFRLIPCEKNPSALGLPAHLAWPGMWEAICPQVSRVLATGEGGISENLLLPTTVNDDDTHWTLSYSPVFSDDDSVSGVLVTALPVSRVSGAQRFWEEKVRQLETVIESAELGTWDSDLITGQYIHNNRLRRLFGFPDDQQLDLADFLTRLNAEDQQRLNAAITESSVPGSTGDFELEYPIHIPGAGALTRRVIRAKGRTMFDQQGAAIRFTGTAEDVTEKHQLRNALEEREREILELFEETPVAIATLSADEHLTFLSANLFYGELVGRKPGDIIGKPLLEALPEIKGQGFDDLLIGVIRTGNPYIAYEIPVKLARSKELETVYVNFSYIPRTNNDGRVVGILVTASDVSYQVRTRQAVEEKEALFRSLIQAAPFPIGVYVGENLRISYANPAIIQVYGKGPDVIGKGYLELVPELLEQGIGQQVIDVYHSGRAFFSDTRRVNIEVNGATISYYFNYNFIPLFDEAGKVYGVLNTGIDVTELELARQRAQEAEANLRSAVELAELANWTIDTRNRVMYLSERLKEWSGLNGSTIDLDDFFALLPSEYLPDTRKAYEEAFRTAHASAFDIEHPLVDRSSGHSRFIHVRGQLVSDASESVFRLSGTMQDITKQRAIQWELERQVAERTTDLAKLNTALQNANFELERKNTELKQSNDELSQYAYVTSHDLQEPLRKIRIYISWLIEKFDLPPDTVKVIEKINKSSARMTQLIQDLLSFSRLLDSNTTMQPVNLSEIVAAVLEDFELSIQEKKATVKIAPLPVITGVALHLNQLFHNLLGNALKFIDPQRSPIISISVRRVDKSEVVKLIPQTNYSSFYVITVADNGIGFEQEYADYIFEVFKQLHTRNRYPGSGIGLSLCRRIALNHGGYIYATSRPGEGSVFHVLLPAGTIS